jgi:hypothetical protein
MVNKCPKCLSDFGFYRITKMKGKGATHYNFDGSIGINDTLHDCLQYKEQKKTFCSECDFEIKGID